MTQETEVLLAHAAKREMKKIYLILCSVVDEATFYTEAQIELQTNRLLAIYHTANTIYSKCAVKESELAQDFELLFRTLMEATVRDEEYEQTANLGKIQERFFAQIPSFLPA